MNIGLITWIKYLSENHVQLVDVFVFDWKFSEELPGSPGNSMQFYSYRIYEDFLPPKHKIANFM